MDKLKTATGKEFSCDYFNPFPPAGQVNIRILSASLVEIATVFGNPAETVQLWYGETQYLAHHTQVVAIVPEGNAIRVVLGKE